MPRPVSRRHALGIFAAVGAAGLLAPACAASGPSAAEAWPQRPVVELSFDLADDLRTVTGREKVVFTPDRPVSELVFRAWPNRPGAAAAGTSLTITGTTIDGRPVTPLVLPAGAPADRPGTLIEIPLPQPLDAGRTVSADLGFTLTLGVDPDDRWGVSPSTQTAWFASGFPLLAWVRGQGWARDPAVAMAGETATSEQMNLASLAVTAPSRCAVSGAGTTLDRIPGTRPDTTTHRFAADAVRDVAVAAGRFRVLDRDVSGVQLHLHTPESGTEVAPETWARQIGEGIDRLTPLLGAFPYQHLWVAVVPSQSSGIEFPGSLQFGDVASDRVPGLVTHELAHQWFYALVGNNQGRDPWIDEGFATYAEVLTTGEEQDYRLSDIAERVSGDLGAPMTDWARRGGFDLYYEGVYRQGAAVLLEARRRAGAETFDDAMRTYLTNNAHRVASPSDVAAAFHDVPSALDLLTQYGALPADR